MRRLGVCLAGAACGVGWWAVSLALGAESYGILGRHAFVGVIAGALTGLTVAAVSERVYRRFSRVSLYWYSPLSVYLSVALYGLLVFLQRLALNDYHPDQILWAVAVQSVVGMWWGITMLLHIAVGVHLLAFANHRLLRRLVVP